MFENNLLVSCLNAHDSMQIIFEGMLFPFSFSCYLQFLAFGLGCIWKITQSLFIFLSVKKRGIRVNIKQLKKSSKWQ